MYFSADDGLNGRELWRSDGTEGGTRVVGDIYPGRGSSNPENLAFNNRLLFFSAQDDNHGVELWAIRVEHYIYLPLVMRGNP